MITCRELAELLIDFLGDELPADHRRLIEEHLCGCTPCVTFVETYQITIRLTRKLPRPDLPAEFAQRLRRVLEHAARRDA